MAFSTARLLSIVLLAFSALSSEAGTNVVRTNLIPNRAIAYSSRSQELFVSGTTRTGPSAFRLFSINPWTGATNWSLPMGTDLSELALAEDQKSLWISLPRSNSVVLLDLQTREIVQKIPIERGATKLAALQLAAVSGQTNLLLVLRGGTSPDLGELLVYSNGVALPGIVRNSGSFFVRGKDVFTRPSFPLPTTTRYLITDQGLAPNGTSPHIHALRVAAFEGHLISLGLFYDLDDTTVLGSVGPVGTMSQPLVFPQARRVLHLENRTLYSHDLDTFRQTSSDTLALALSPLDPPIVVPLDERGIAVATPNYVAVVEPAVLPSPQSADLGISLEGAADPVDPATEFSLRIVVTNRGPAAATGVIVTNLFGTVVPQPPWIVSQGTYTNRFGQAVFYLGEIAPQGSAEMILKMVPQAGAASFANSATITSPTREADESDDAAVLSTAVRAPGDERTISIADVPARSLARSPKGGLVYGLTRNTAGKLGNSLVRIANGLVEANWFVGSEPRFLALSESGDLAWIGLIGATTNLILFDLVTERIEGRFVVPSITFMQMLPGSERTVAMAHPTGLAIYDNGIARAKTIDNPSFAVSFSFGSNSNFWLFGKDNVLHEVAVEQEGLREIPHAFAPIPEVYGDLAVFGNRGLSGHGTFLDLETGTRLRQGTRAGQMAVNQALGKAFIYTEGVSELRIVDGATAVPLGSVPIAGFAPPNEFVVAGGQAALARGNIVASVDSPLFVDHGERDLAVSASAENEPVTGGDFVYVVGVTNKSALAASNVVVTVDLPAELAWQGADLPPESIVTNANFYAMHLGTIPGNSARTIRVRSQPQMAGAMRSTFQTASLSRDIDYSDNSRAVESYSTFVSAPDSVLRLKFDSAFAGVDPSTGLLQLLSRPSTNASSSITSIDPATGRILEVRPVGTNATRFVHTPEGRYIYAIVEGGFGLQRISLRGEEPDLFVQFERPISDLAVKPGEPGTYAVCDGELTRVYDGATQRPTVAQGHLFLEFSDDGSLLFGFNGSYDTMVLTPEGVSITERKGNLPNGGVTDMRQEGGLLLTSSGYVIDPVKGKWISSFGLFFFNVPLPEFSAGRAYFAMNYLIGIYDSQTTKLLRPIYLPADLGEIGERQLVRWGKDGLLFRTTNALLIIRAPEIPSGPATELEVRLHEQTLAATANREEIRYIVDFANRGTNAVTSALVHLRFPPVFDLGNFTSTLGAAREETNTIMCPIGTLAAGATGQVRVTVSAPSGAFIVDASISSDAREAVTWNNFAAMITSVLLPFRLDNPEMLPINAAQMVPIPHGQFCIVTRAEAPNGLNCRFFTLDPATGKMSEPIWLGFEPNRVAVSDYGRYAYASLFPSGKMFRIDLHRGAIDLAFELPGPLTARDLAVVPGQPTWLVAARSTHGVSPDDVGAVLLVDGQPAGEIPARTIGVLSQGSQLWGYGGAGVVPIQAAPGNLQMGASVAPLEGVTDLEYHNGRIYADNARVIDVARREIVATFQELTFGGEVAVDRDGPSFYYNQGGAIHKFDQQSLTFVTNKVIGNGWIAGFADFHLWGADGFAFRSGDRVYLMRSSLADVASTGDLDGDTLPDDWEWRNGTNPNRIDAQTDLDRDGRTNLEEHQAGTNPNDPLPLLLRVERSGPGGIIFALDVKTGGEYSLQKKPVLDDSPLWETVGTFTAEGSVGRLTVPVNPAGHEFFRLLQVR